MISGSTVAKSMEASCMIANGKVSPVPPPQSSTGSHQLADLKSLSLERTEVYSEHIHTYPFSLTHLALGDDHDCYIPDEMLVALSCQVSITSLKLALAESTTRTLDMLSPLASRLVRLDLNAKCDKEEYNPVDSGERAVNRFLERCTQLKHIALDADNTPSLVHLTNSLESWTVTSYRRCHITSHPLEGDFDVLYSSAAAVSTLQHLCLCVRGHDIRDRGRLSVSWFGRKKIEEVCREKKIRLSLRLHDSEEEEGESIFILKGL